MPVLVQGYNIGDVNIFLYFEGMDQVKEDILTVSLNPIGAAQLKKLYSTAKWLFRIGLFNCVFAAICEFVRYAYTNLEKYKVIYPLYLQLKVGPWYIMLYSIFFIVQMSLYLRWVRRINRALNALDNETFNESFLLLNRFNQWALWGTGLNALFVILSVWVTYATTFALAK